MDCVRLIPGWPEWNCRSNCARKVAGITMRSWNIRQSFTTQRVSRRLVRCLISPSNLVDGHFVRVKFIAFHKAVSFLVAFWTSAAVTGSARTALDNTMEAESSEDNIAAITESSFTVAWLLISLDRASAWQKLSVWRYWMSKPYPNNTKAQRCRRLAEWTGMPFLEPKIDSSGLWSVRRVNRRPYMYLWKHRTATTRERASFSI